MELTFEQRLEQAYHRFCNMRHTRIEKDAFKEAAAEMVREVAPDAAPALPPLTPDQCKHVEELTDRARLDCLPVGTAFGVGPNTGAAL